MKSPRWTEITPSEYAWEREALDYIRARLPDSEPFRAWSNSEFIADDGSINEVDLHPPWWSAEPPRPARVHVPLPEPKPVDVEASSEPQPDLFAEAA